MEGKGGRYKSVYSAKDTSFADIIIIVVIIFLSLVDDVIIFCDDVIIECPADVIIFCVRESGPSGDSRDDDLDLEAGST